MADIAGSNPNVFYELGFAHASGRDVIILCQESSKRLPFDIAQERTVFYVPTGAGLLTLEDELRKLVADA